MASTAMRERRKCPICSYSVTIRRNGYPERHYLYTDQKWACPGGEEQRNPTDTPRYPIALFLFEPKDPYIHE